MLRFVAFLAGAFVLSRLLAHAPVIGGLFRHTGIFGVWITAILLSWVFTWAGARAVQVQRDRGEMRRLSAVGSPYNHGKLGMLLLKQGRPKKALGHLEQAALGEPDVAEWHYRYGLAKQALGHFEDAAAAFSRAVAIEEEHAYGAAQMRLAEARLALGQAQESLTALEVFERNHGPQPESAYRTALALKGLGRKDEARQALSEVDRLASEAARYQRGSAQRWSWKARLARLGL